MKFENSAYPNEAQMQQFGNANGSQPIYTLNLRKLKEQAFDAEVRETNFNGRCLTQ